MSVAYIDVTRGPLAVWAVFGFLTGCLAVTLYALC